MPYKNPEKQKEYLRQYGLRYYPHYYQQHRSEKLAYYHRYYREHRAEKIKYSQERTDKKLEFHQKQKYGSVQRYLEAILKYDGWCAFACDNQAQLVHHMDGKNIRNSPKEQVNNNLTNLLPLCKSCHGWLHKKTRRHTNVR